MNLNVKSYRWPNLSAVIRQYVVLDDQGRIGIAYADSDTATITAHPATMADNVPAGTVRGTENLPVGSTVLTGTVWHWSEQAQAYTGTWCDYDGPTFPVAVPPEMIRRLTIIADLGWLMPDWIADDALVDSDQPGYWDYGAKLGKVGGEPPIKDQLHNEMTVEQAVEFAREVGEPKTDRTIRNAANRGHIPGARKSGRDWLIPYDGFNTYLDNPPKPGPKKA